MRIGNDCKLACFSAEGHRASIRIADGVYMGSNITISTADSVIIEPNVLMASYISILGDNHDWNPDIPHRLNASPIRIGHHTWIGQNVVIVAGNRPNLEIGQWCIIGAGSVVTRSIPDYSIAVGNPARVIKKYDFETHQWKKYKQE